MEDRPSVFSVKNEPGHHQLKQSSPHHQQRWGQPAASTQPQSSPVNKVVLNSSKTQQSSSPATYIVPIVVEGSNDRTTKIINNPYQQSGPTQNQVNKYVIILYIFFLSNTQIYSLINDCFNCFIFIY